MSDLRYFAHALGGVVSGANSISCPGPGHHPDDRSVSVTFNPSAPDGFLVSSYGRTDWREAKDHVRRILGIKHGNAPRGPEACKRPQPSLEENRDRIAAALALWDGAADPRGTLAEKYLNSRALDLHDDVAGEVLRWHPGIHAMVALFRDVRTNEPRAISRTFLDREGRKITRRFLGPVSHAAIKIDADESVLGGLTIGEGIETCLAGRQIGLKPCWALGSAVAISNFPVLNGIEALWLLREIDAANMHAAIACKARWEAAGREVFDNWPSFGSDMNDSIQERAA